LFLVVVVVGISAMVVFFLTSSFIFFVFPRILCQMYVFEKL
jgi:hypothetical protein